MSNSADDLVPDVAVDDSEVLRRGVQNCGDEHFALFKCPNCGRVYLLECEAETVYLEPADLSRRFLAFGETFDCVSCGMRVPDNEPWVGPRASPRFGVTWEELSQSDWRWVARFPSAPSRGKSELKLKLSTRALARQKRDA